MKRLFIPILALLLTISCYKEKNLQPTEEDEKIYSEYDLPQGNHDFDTYIVEFFKNYQTVILYKYDLKEFWWKPDGDIRWKWDTIRNDWGWGYEALEADENYVGKQLDLMKETWFDFFPDDFLLKTLPPKILLFSELNWVMTDLAQTPDNFDRQQLNVLSSYDYIGVNRGNSDILSITAEEKAEFKNDVCKLFLEWARTSKTVTVTEEFTMMTSYSQRITEENKYELGLLVVTTSSTTDWDSYIATIVSTPYDQLEEGILHEDTDVNGLIRKKYDLVIAYFNNELNIDLQAIGNKQYN